MKTREQKFNAFHKIVKCIYSSKTSEHLDSCEKMIGNFLYLFKNYYDAKFEAEVLHEEIVAVKKNKSII